MRNGDSMAYKLSMLSRIASNPLSAGTPQQVEYNLTMFLQKWMVKKAQAGSVAHISPKVTMSDIAKEIETAGSRRRLSRVGCGGRTCV